MGNEYRAEKNLLASELFDGRLEKFGVHEHGQARENHRCLTDCENCLGVLINDAGHVTGFAREWNGNWGSPNKILSTVSDAFETKIFSYQEPEYFGLESEEEKAAWCPNKKTWKNGSQSVRQRDSRSILTLRRSIGRTGRYPIRMACVQICRMNGNALDGCTLPDRPEAAYGFASTIFQRRRAMRFGNASTREN
jgi:hypothetical protein